MSDVSSQILSHSLRSAVIALPETRPRPAAYDPVHAPAHAPAYAPAYDSKAIARVLSEAILALDHDKRAASAAICRAAAMLAGNQASPAAPAATRRGGLVPWQVTRVVDHIDQNLAGPITNQALASLLRLSTNHFSRAFKITLQQTPHAFIMRRRIERAQAMMLETDEALGRIAPACGLADQAHLSRMFRRELGESPKTWRLRRRAAERAA